MVAINIIICLGQVDENMQKAQLRDALRTQKFWFRKDVTTGDSPSCCQTPTSCSPDDCATAQEYTLMTINEIINGKVGISFSKKL